VSLYVREREPWCVVCGSTERLTNGHIFSRASYSLRWDIRRDGNSQTQCWGCNYRHEFDHYPYFNWYIEKYSKEKLDKLHIDWKQPKRYKDFDLEDLYDDIKAKYEKLKEENEMRVV